MYLIEDTTDIIGAYCTLLKDSRGICDGQIVESYSSEIIVRLQDGNEIATRRDEVIIFD